MTSWLIRPEADETGWDSALQGTALRVTSQWALCHSRKVILPPVPQLLHLQNETSKSTSFIRLVCRSREKINVKCLKQSLAHNRCSRKVSYCPSIMRQARSSFLPVSFLEKRATAQFLRKSQGAGMFGGDLLGERESSYSPRGLI